MPAVINIKEKREYLYNLLDGYGIIIKKQKAGNCMDDIFSAILDVGRGMLNDAVLALNAKTDRDDETLWLPLVVHLRDTAAVMAYLSIPRTRGDNPRRWQWCSRRKPYRPLLGSPVKEKQ